MVEIGGIEICVHCANAQLCKDCRIELARTVIQEQGAFLDGYARLHDAVMGLKTWGTDMNRSDIERCFSYHPPKEGQAVRYIAIRDAAKQLALLLLDKAPDSSELNLAVHHLEEVVFWANAAIARNE
jgi:hypothetical protein